MPGVVLFKRRWGFASDDLVFPGIFEIFVRTVWLIVIAAVFHTNRSTLGCSGGHILKAYYVGTIVLLAGSLVPGLVIVYVSMQGTMTNVRPRRRMPLLLYIKLGIGIPEIAWTILGTYWAFGKSYGCDSEVVHAVKALVLCGWVAYLFVGISMAVLFDPLGRKRACDQSMHQGSLVRSDGQQFMASATSAAKRVWETRCKILCCCVGCDEQSQTAFSDTAKLMSLFFQDVDLVPTDIGAGLILLHHKHLRNESRLTRVVTEQHSLTTTTPQTGHTLPLQSATETNSSPAESALSPQGTISPIPVNRSTRLFPKDWMSMRLITHYMKFSMASYGWPLYVYSNLLTGVCKLYPHCRCCNCMFSAGSVLHDNSCQCNTAAIRKFTGVENQDIIYASFHNKIYKIPFFVSVDREHGAVVIAIRGSMSLKDALTDLTAECDSLDIEGLADCYAHKGILTATNTILKELQQQHILEKAFTIGQGFDLVVCGHSLGAGAAVLLATMLRPQYPEVRCYAYSPPGGLLSPSVSQHSQEYAVSVVLGKDLIPRLSLVTMENLKMKLLKAIQDCHVPKYEVLLGGCWGALFGVAGGPGSDRETESSEASRPLLEGNTGSSSPYTQAHNSPEAIRDAIMSTERSRITQAPLLPPGQILHIIEVESSKSWCGSPRYSAVWSSQDVFDEIIVSPKMVSDHLPDAVMAALDQLNGRHFSPPQHLYEQPGVEHI